MRFKFFSWVFLCVTLLSGLSMQSAQASPQEDQKTYNVSISLKDATVKGGCGRFDKADRNPVLL